MDDMFYYIVVPIGTVLCAILDPVGVYKALVKYIREKARKNEKAH